ncbi:MAG: 50S ribosomal protein L3 [Candidatus Aenigmarchaeota archaeon]|nr:50S ribosomal protein L3 [Candidatus Aenigmarchaeota archaeon]
MAKHHKPREGSTAYWHRKRARRIYPRMNVLPSVKEAVPLVFAGYKAGMTSISYVDARKGSHTEGQEVVKAATILDCPPLSVCGIRLYEKTAYGAKCVGAAWAEKLSKDLGRKTSLPEKHDTKRAVENLEKKLDEKSEVRLLVNTNPRFSGIGKKKPEVFEVGVGGSPKAAFDYAKSKLGSELKASNVLKQGEMVDARAVTTGMGYTGPVKRFGIRVRSRKSKHKRRHVGTLGPQNPPKVIPGGKVPEAGQMGFHNRTEYNKKILRVAGGGLNPRGDWVSYGRVSGDYVIIEGSLPGPKKRLILLRPAMRAKNWSNNPIELKYVSLEPQN